MTPLEAILRQVGSDLTDASLAFALVGGLAVSARTEPRFTRDADLAVAVADTPKPKRSFAVCARRATASKLS